MGIPLVPAGTESHWQQGQVEVHGGVWKLAFQKLASLHSLTTDDFDRVARGFVMTNRARNNRHRHQGYSLLQWALGFSPNLPGSLLEDGENLAIQETLRGPSSPFKDRLEMQHHAELAFLEADNDSRIRRALLSKARPHRGPFPPGSQVYFSRRHDGMAKADIESCWQGPAVVICQSGSSI